ncbi:MAG: 1,4-dihydroxy-2-naphthoate octaprenyltransferase [Rubrivivax sp.]|nr:1,4-dihydroxy-2-naphthoate octaprenyltransferase [Rubrivivax sp.]
MSPESSPPPSALHIAWVAIRPRTLPLAVTPVLLGSALAIGDGHALHVPSLLLALACSLLIQIATNLHNDAADFIRGTDMAGRIGPIRVTAAGWASAKTLTRASLACLALAMLLGLALVLRGGWPILLAGLASMLAAWSYSGGPWPVSRGAWGEVLVILFFGIVAVSGSHWLQGLTGSFDTVLAGLAVGLPAAAVLLVNNYRDLDNDVRSGRRTLAWRLGQPGARTAYAALLLLPFLALAALAAQSRPGLWIAMAVMPLAFVLIRRLQARPPGPWLNQHLALTAQFSAGLGLLMAIGALL